MENKEDKIEEFELTNYEENLTKEVKISRFTNKQKQHMILASCVLAIIGIIVLAVLFFPAEKESINIDHGNITDRGMYKMTPNCITLIEKYQDGQLKYAMKCKQEVSEQEKQLLVDNTKKLLDNLGMKYER